MDQQKEYQVEVNAETGEFTKEKVETLDADEQNGVKMQEEALDLTNIISREQATTLAEKEAKVGQATDWKLEKEFRNHLLGSESERGPTKNRGKNRCSFW